MSPLVIRVPYSHLFRGLRLLVEDGARLAEAERPLSQLAFAFADGSHTAAELLVDENGRAAMHVQAYTTARGTSIAARVWLVSVEKAPFSRLSLRLEGRLPLST